MLPAVELEKRRAQLSGMSEVSDPKTALVYVLSVCEVGSGLRTGSAVAGISDGSIADF